VDGVLIAGIVNVTPDSFSDGGLCTTPEEAASHAGRLIEEGADWIDVGGESTRPGAPDVPFEEELARVVPTVEAIRAGHRDVVISVDTSKPEIAAQALRAGANVINDVTALSHPRMAKTIAEHHGGVVLMHMRGTPRTMQADTRYADLVSEVIDFLNERKLRAVNAGIPLEKIYLDPGVGFGKDAEGCATLIAELGRVTALGCRVMVGASRKSFIGALTGVADAQARWAGSVGAALAAVESGAKVLRVHDVAETKRSLLVYRACRGHA
jgi:dihydropteroate synthase